MLDGLEGLKPIEEFTLADMETVGLILRGDSVADWFRLALSDEDEARALLEAQEFRPDEPSDRARLEKIKNEAITFLRRHFDFPMPSAGGEEVQRQEKLRWLYAVRQSVFDGGLMAHRPNADAVLIG